MQSQKEDDLYLSVITFCEIEKGIEKAVDVNERKKLQFWVEDDLKKRFEGRIIPKDMDVSVKWMQSKVLLNC